MHIYIRVYAYNIIYMYVYTRVRITHEILANNILFDIIDC